MQHTLYLTKGLRRIANKQLWQSKIRPVRSNEIMLPNGVQFSGEASVVEEIVDEDEVAASFEAKHQLSDLIPTRG